MNTFDELINNLNPMGSNGHSDLEKSFLDIELTDNDLEPNTTDVKCKNVLICSLNVLGCHNCECSPG